MKYNTKERVSKLTPEKKEELKQYVSSIKEIKRKIQEMLSEVGGDTTNKTLKLK